MCTPVRDTERKETVEEKSEMRAVSALWRRVGALSSLRQREAGMSTPTRMLASDSSDEHKADVNSDQGTSLEGDEVPPTSNNTDSSDTSPTDSIDIDSLKEQLNQAEQRALDAEQRAHENNDRAKRMASEVEDIRARTARDKQASQKFALQSVAKDLLPVSDNLQRALSSSNSSEYDNESLLRSLQDGVSMVEKMLLDTLGKHGVSRFEPDVGDEFNPEIMEAMYQVPATASSAAPNTVVQVNKAGFYLHDRVLRAAEVGVAVDAE